MASHVLTRPDVFASGSVSAYLWTASGVPDSGAPKGSAVSTASVSGNSVTFTGLADGTRYIAYQGSPDRYVQFTTAPAAAAGATTVATDTLWDAKGDIAVASGADAASRLAVGSNNQVLTADSAQALGVKWAAAAGGGAVATDAIFDAKGDLPVGTGADTASKLTVGTNGQVLQAASGQATGLQWTDADLQPTLVLPLAFQSLPSGHAVVANLRSYFMRFVMPKTGTLAGIAYWIAIASGNYDCGVYDTGEASAGNRTRLFSTGSTAVPAAGWKELATPNLSVTRGQHVDIMIAFDNTTVSVGRQVNSSNTGSPTILPNTYAAAAGGANSKVMGLSSTLGSLVLPTSFSEAVFLDAGTSIIPSPICRVT